MSLRKDASSYGLQSLSLLDENFLATLSEQRDREIHARVISLDINENPIDQIEGRVTGGTINIDGSSAVRRTCSLTMISENVDINDFYWGIKTKFKLEIGLRNKLTGEYAPVENGSYPEIVWFPQGYFLVTSFNTAISTNSCTVSLQGKDKMSLLNGDLGGQLFASIDFGTEETVVTVMEPVTLETSSTSEGITLSKYYIKPSSDEDSIIDTNPFYTFIPTKDGKYYKKNNTYYLAGANRPAHYNYYDMYKIVKEPKELYQQVSFSENLKYEPNKYYYLKNDGYYVLETKTSADSGKNYYQLVQLYQKYSDVTKKKITLEKIIREAVHAYAKEPYHNIIINDLDDYGLEQLTYKGDETLYALYNTTEGQFSNLILGDKNSSLTDIINNLGVGFQFQPLTTSLNLDHGTLLQLNDKEFSLGGVFGETGVYTVAKITYGMDIGYRLTDLVYTGDLISNVGDSLTSVLDKIKQMLGEFEYFYDLDGHFVFQRKQTYVETSWSQLTDNEDEAYVDFANSKRKFSFNFEGNRLISAIQNSPVLNNLRNDFTVWGKRKGVSGADIPIHARYAIDKKPNYYKALNGKIYTTNIAYAFEQNSVSKSEYQAIQGIREEIRNFTLTANYPSSGLQKPIKNNNGTWTPGWWHISDWARYYKLLMNTTKDPMGTMKFYSLNDENGCVPIQTILNLPGFAQKQTNYNNSRFYVWLIEINKTTNAVNIGHGHGEYNTSNRDCTYYESELKDGKVVTTATSIKKNFISPYSGCADTHTYLYFADRLKNYDVYFYNPNFPTGETAEELIEADILNNKIRFLENHNVYIVDWREIIYQMALDFFAGQGCSAEDPLYIAEQQEVDGVLQFEDEEKTIPKMNWEAMTDPDHFLYEVGRRNPYYYPTGYTGYEQYYTDMQGFWRQLYNPNYVPEPIYSDGYYDNINVVTNQGYYTKQKKWVQPFIQDYNIDYYVSPAKKEIQIQRQELNRLNEDAKIKGNIEYSNLLTDLIATYDSFIADVEEETSNRLYWNRLVYEQPEALNFWIDFLDSDLELAQFSIPQVGDRSKVVKEDKAGAIIYTDIPNFILYEYKAKDSEGNLIEKCDESKLRREIGEKSGYNFMYLPKGFSQYFTISYRNTSVKRKIDELLYQYGYCIENITITAIPVYHLQPNTRIFVQDKDTGIDGEYIVSKITLPLTYNGTMSITAVKAPERLY